MRTVRTLGTFIHLTNKTFYITSLSPLPVTSDISVYLVNANFAFPKWSTISRRMSSIPPPSSTWARTNTRVSSERSGSVRNSSVKPYSETGMRCTRTDEDLIKYGWEEDVW